MEEHEKNDDTLINIFRLLHEDRYLHIILV